MVQNGARATALKRAARWSAAAVLAMSMVPGVALAAEEELEQPADAEAIEQEGPAPDQEFEASVLSDEPVEAADALAAGIVAYAAVDVADGHLYDMPVQWLKEGSSDASMAGRYLEDTAAVRYTGGAYQVTIAANEQGLEEILSVYCDGAEATNLGNGRFRFSVASIDGSIPLAMGIKTMQSMGMTEPVALDMLLDTAQATLSSDDEVDEPVGGGGDGDGAADGSSNNGSNQGGSDGSSAGSGDGSTDNSGTDSGSQATGANMISVNHGSGDSATTGAGATQGSASSSGAPTVLAQTADGTDLLVAAAEVAAIVAVAGATTAYRRRAAQGETRE
ncbi:MAG: hypothetical protein HFJ72_00560 [Adlercreutzia sp.]|nr:hypothetical protein [Adlercreutzia sp.]